MLHILHFTSRLRKVPQPAICTFEAAGKRLGTSGKPAFRYKFSNEIEKHLTARKAESAT